MRTARVIRRGQTATYHCISRTVAGQHLFTDLEKEVFTHRMYKLAEFLKVRIVNFVILSNHWHVTPRLPTKIHLSNQQLLRALKKFYGPKHQKTKEFQDALGNPADPLLEMLRENYLQRMGDLSTFMKELKEGFSKWFNDHHQRFGTLWAERFKSILMPEDNWDLIVLAAYIDLNPVRSGAVLDPKDYRFSSYGQAVARDGPARQGLASILPGKTWAEQSAHYRMILYTKGAAPKGSQARIDPAQALAVLEAKGEISLTEMLHLKVRWFTEGIALGTEKFATDYVEEFGKNLARKRVQQFWPLIGTDWKGRVTLRRLRNPVQLPRKSPSEA